jgi:hypothetical protein
VDVGTDHVTNTAMETLFLVGETRRSVGSCLQCAQVVSRAEGDASAAFSTEVILLNFSHQISKSLDIRIHGLKSFQDEITNPL